MILKFHLTFTANVTEYKLSTMTMYYYAIVEFASSFSLTVYFLLESVHLAMEEKWKVENGEETISIVSYFLTIFCMHATYNPLTMAFYVLERAYVFMCKIHVERERGRANQFISFESIVKSIFNVANKPFRLNDSC